MSEDIIPSLTDGDIKAIHLALNDKQKKYVIACGRLHEIKETEKGNRRYVRVYDYIFTTQIYRPYITSGIFDWFSARVRAGEKMTWVINTESAMEWGLITGLDSKIERPLPFPD